MTARRLIPLLMTMTVLAGMPAAPADAGPRVIKGSFTATAVPFPNPYEVSDLHGCAGGTEGQHKVSHPFTAPFGGWLRVAMSFEGDWDLFLADGEGEPIATSYRYKTNLWESTWPERIDHYLAPGQEVTIVACNWAGSPEAEVHYRLKAARPWPGPPTGRATHEELIPYAAPALATTEAMVGCSDLTYGCYSLPVWGGDRFVSVEVDDSMSDEVAFSVGQFRRGTFVYGKFHCGSTARPVRIQPQADMLSVMIAVGPCENGSDPYIPTRGTIRARFTG